MAAPNLYLENYIPCVKLGKAVRSKFGFVGTTLTATSTLTALSGAAATSGGNVNPGLVIASTTTGSGVGVYFGNGAPTITAPQGSLYLNTTGSSTSTRLYVNQNGSTTWTNVVTAA